MNGYQCGDEAEARHAVIHMGGHLCPRKSHFYWPTIRSLAGRFLNIFAHTTSF